MEQMEPTYSTGSTELIVRVTTKANPEVKNR